MYAGTGFVCFRSYVEAALMCVAARAAVDRKPRDMCA